VPKARTYGAELTLDWRATKRLSAHAALGLLDTKITGTKPESEFLRGKEFARSPGLTASGAIDWRPIDPLRLSAQVRHHSSYFSNDRETQSLRVRSATLVDARASWIAGQVTLFGYVRNLFDTFRIRFLFEPTPLTNPPSAAAAHDPREFGFGIESRF